ncbi:uncharacterized protein KIAA0825 homolog isoform X3 [Pygocentrus nattereri]|uniref:Uncharacterized protein n=1 Tax=Pygocentrus nattereri TaxID=42514 RepID=A0AAR2JR45_PYGNA|nr:uncharacterized protein KIAA0825 homolog isoform X3 [Pygocentrus nattereri]
MEWLGDFPHDHAFVDLLMSDVPGEVDLQHLIRDTEEKLKLNASSIEQNLRELQGKIGEAWIGERVPSPTECLQWFSQRNLSSLKPISTGYQELLDFLKALQHLLKTQEAREEAVLQLLLNISSQCGVAFPCSGPLSEQAHSPVPPVCSVQDDLALEVQETWDDVRLLLRRHLLDKLQPAEEPSQSGQSAEGTIIGSRVAQKILILQQLSFLYPETEVLVKYQVLQSRRVLGLLRSTQTCSPGGERGFDRLALGFQTASPSFCAMLSEEIHILNGIAEPHSILTFLNQAYLSTLAQELSILMAREVEAVLKDNTARGGKTGKSSSKKSAVAPQEAPLRARNFCLTSHQLKCLTQLAVTLLELERNVDDLATELGFLNCAGESACSLRGILKNVKDDMDVTVLEGKTTPDVLFQNTEAVCLEFEWRAAFQELVPQMAHCVKVFLEDVCSKSLHREQATYTSGSTLIPLVNVSLRPGTELTCPEKDISKRIAKFCADVLEELDALLPLAVACKDDTLRSCYVEVCGRVTFALLARLEERSGQVPTLAPLKNLPTLLASSIYIQQRLTHYESQLRDTTRIPLTLLPIQRSQDVTAAVHELLTSYCIHVCATSILQDAESHYWADPKPFYEGERCSFSIQMWHYFILGLRSDLWGSVSPVLAQQTLAQVLAKTLELLLQRYSRAQPSYKRLSQIRVDITAILLCVEELMWSLCGSVEELVRPCLASGNWVSCIHSLCNQLLSVCAILTAPLPQLYSTFQNGLSEGTSNTLAKANSSHAPFWLNVINPTLFPQELLRESSVSSEGSALWLLKLVTSGPGCCPVIVLQAMLHSDCLLLRLLLSHSHLCLDCEAEVSLEAQKAAAEFVEAVFTILSSLNNVPRALALALEGYLDRRHLWDHFYNLADKAREAPALFKCIRTVMSKPISSLIGHLVSMIQTYEDLPGTLLRQDLPESVLAKIPKEWNYTPQDAKTKHISKSNITLAIQALSFIFTHLPSAVASLPLPVRFLFYMAEKRLSQHARQLRPTGLLVWTLLSCLCQGLEDGETLELMSAQPLERGAKERLALLSECLQVSLGQQKGVPKLTVHKVLQGLEEKKPKWSSMQLQKARKFCSESVFERVESGVVQERGGPVELPEQKMWPESLAVCQGAGGIQNLRQIHHTIQLNEGLLRSKLASAEDPSTSFPEGLSSVRFSSAVSSQSGLPLPFNPLYYFDHIDHAKFDQSALSEREWDWAQLLPSNQRLSQVTFRALLANRWEMQDAAPLEDEEKILVDHLKKTFLNRAPES